MLASLQGHSTVVQLLLEARTLDVNQKNQASVDIWTIPALACDLIVWKIGWANSAHGSLQNRPHNCSTGNADGSHGGAKWEGQCTTHSNESVIFADFCYLGFQDGRTALMMASHGGHTDTLLALLANDKVDVNLQDQVCGPVWGNGTFADCSCFDCWIANYRVAGLP